MAAAIPCPPSTNRYCEDNRVPGAPDPCSEEDPLTPREAYWTLRRMWADPTAAEDANEAPLFDALAAQRRAEWGNCTATAPAPDTWRVASEYLQIDNRTKPLEVRGLLTPFVDNGYQRLQVHDGTRL